MTFFQVQYALAVARYKNFTKAAESLYMSQPALSLQIKKLEQELGYPLFKRLPQGVALTPDSEAFFKDAQALEEAWNRLNQNVSIKDKKERHLSVFLNSRVYTNGMFDHIAAFMKEHPEIEMTFHTDAGSDCFADLLNHKLDVVLERLPSSMPVSNFEKMYACELITESQYVLVSPNNGMYRDCETLTFEKLSGADMVLGLKNSLWEQALLALLEKNNAAPGKIYRADNIWSAMELVQRGNGFLLGSASYADYFGVRAIPLEPELKLSLNFACLKERAKDPAIALLRDHLVRACRNPFEEG